MPIPREQFDKEGDQTENQILEFLKQHPEETYECHKVTKGIGLTDKGVPMVLRATPNGLGIEGTLNELVKRGLVDKKIKDGMNRYSIHRY